MEIKSKLGGIMGFKWKNNQIEHLTYKEYESSVLIRQ